MGSLTGRSLGRKRWLFKVTSWSHPKECGSIVYPSSYFLHLTQGGRVAELIFPVSHATNENYLNRKWLDAVAKKPALTLVGEAAGPISSIFSWHGCCGLSRSVVLSAYAEFTNQHPNAAQ